VRESWEAIRERAALDYGLTAAIGVGLPLIVGALAGAAADGVLVGLGAYFVAISVPDGPYGQPAWRLWATLGVIAASIGLGSVLAGHLWLAVCVVPLVAALGVVVEWIGVPAAIVLIVTVVKAVGTDSGGRRVAAWAVMAPAPGRGAPTTAPNAEE
jgi:hypothetical protein